MRNTIEAKDKLADKLSESEKNEISDALTNAEDWLNSNQEAEKDEFEDQMKELQSVCDPIIARIYEEMGGQG
jgi:molecular chaperone DnaK (HSP70)